MVFCPVTHWISLNQQKLELVVLFGGDAPRSKFRQQLSDSCGGFAVAWDDTGPFQVFAEFSGANAPSFENGGDRRPYLNQGEMTRQGQGLELIRARPAEDEMVVSVDENADHIS
jgi:hypothetical protein